MSSPNVLLVIADSVRAENTSIHDHRHETTPFLEDFADTATVYEQARAPANWSLPSHTSMFTGHHVREHGVTGAGDAIEPGNTVFDDLQARGYETAVFSENPYLTSLDTGLASGFDTVEGAVQDQPFEGVNPDEYKGDVGGFVRAALGSGRPARSLANGVVSKLAWDYPGLVPARLQRNLASGVTPGSTYTDLFRDWMQRTDGPWAACLNYMDAHHPYAPASEFDEWDDGTIASVQQGIDSMPLGFYSGTDPWWKCELLEHLYDGTIRQIDHEIERLVTTLRETNAFEDTLVIVTSDHGEGFGERSALRDLRLAGHNVGEHEVNLHVPLLVKRPAQRTGSVERQPVSLTGLPAVIASAVEDETPSERLHEYSVIARTRGPLDAQMETLADRDVDLEPFEGQADVLYREVDGAVQKLQRWNDRVVQTAVSDPAAETADESALDAVLADLSDAGIARCRDDETVDEGIEQRLEALGYR